MKQRTLEQVKQNKDLQKIANLLLPMGKELLEKGDLLVTSAAMDNRGKVTLATTGSDDQMESLFLEEKLAEQAKAGQIRACGIMFHALHQPPGGSNYDIDCICIQLEHKNGDAYAIEQIFKKRRKAAVTFGKLVETLEVYSEVFKRREIAQEG
jgi:hypothetical protein